MEDYSFKIKSALISSFRCDFFPYNEDEENDDNDEVINWFISIITLTSIGFTIILT